MQGSRHATPGSESSDAEAILEIALDLAERRGWDALHLHDLALEAGIDLTEIHRHYAQKDALAEAWFDRADAALLAAAGTPGWRGFSTRKRLHRALFAWLDALAAHREVTRSMLRYKFQPDHLHLQFLGLTRISRTVQWIREVALLESTGLRRELEEVTLSGIYLTTFACWLTDASPGSARTHALLDRLLRSAERVVLMLPGQSVTTTPNPAAEPAPGAGDATPDIHETQPHHRVH